VAVRGLLVEMREGRWVYGVVRDGTGEAAFLARTVPADLVPGAEVRVAGVVSRGKISVKREGDISVLSPPGRVTAELLLRNPWYYRGLEVVVEGSAFSFSAHYYEGVYLVSDGTATARVLFQGDVEGTSMHLYGRVVMADRYEIDATAYGLYPDVQGMEAEDISLAEMEEHEGEVVHAVVDVLGEYCVGTFFLLRDGEYTLKCFMPGQDVYGSGWARVRGTLTYFEDEGRYVLVCDEVTFLRG
jgi:hypothetical protein